jgi:hypothetical protein
VNVSPPDFLPLHEIARILGKRYVEVTAKQALSAIEFMWDHDLADITPGEAAGISYLPRMATDRLQNEWGFECAWSTAEAVLDLRRAVSGITAAAKHRVAIPWKLQFPTQRPGDAPVDGERLRPAVLARPGELDTLVPAGRAYSRVTDSDVPLPALTLTTHAYVLRSVAPVASFGHRLYLGDPATAPNRLLARTFGREVDRIASWAGDTLARAHDLESQSDVKLEATLSALRDELAWFWSIAATGAMLDGEPFAHLDGLIVTMPSGAPLGIRPPASGGHAAARAQAELTALALGQALAAAIRERAARLETDPEHLTFDELLMPPGDVAAVVKRRKAEHRRLQKLSLPATVSALPAVAAINLNGKEARAWTPSLTT